MEKKRTMLLILSGIFVLTFTGCTPRLYTEVSKPGPPICDADDVRVFHGQIVRDSVRVVKIGKFDSETRPFSNDCFRRDVVYMRGQTAKYGGNAVGIRMTSVMERSDPYYRIQADMYRVVDPAALDGKGMLIETRSGGGTCISLGVGGVYILTPIECPDPITGRVETGFGWQLGYQRVGETGLGFGFLYEGYVTKIRFKNPDAPTGQEKDKMNGNSLMLVFVYKPALGEKKRWLLEMDAGMGMAIMNNKVEVWRPSSSHVGVAVALVAGAEYKLTRYFGFGAQISLCMNHFSDKQHISTGAFSMKPTIFTLGCRGGMRFYF